MQFATALEDSGVIAKDVWNNAYFRVAHLYLHHTATASTEYWLEDIRSDFVRALDEELFDFAAALAHEALVYSRSPDMTFQMLVMQGIALNAMLEAGGAELLHDLRCAAFAQAIQALPESRGWTHADVVCRIHLARAQLECGILRLNLDDLECASNEFAVLLPAFEEGRWGFATHAEAAEIAAYLAKAEEARAKLGEPADPLPHWLHALGLAFDPDLRADDILGNWDRSGDILEKWLDGIRFDPNARTACAAAADKLCTLSISSVDDNYGRAQYYIGVLSLAAGLQPEGSRMKAGDETKLAPAVAALRNALAEEQEGDGIGWHSTAFQLAYALHALGEVQPDTETMIESLALYERVAQGIAQDDSMEKQLLLAQVQVNFSEAMAQLAKIRCNADLARQALQVAGEAERNFTLWAHDNGIEIAQANTENIAVIIDKIETA